MDLNAGWMAALNSVELDGSNSAMRVGGCV